MNSEGNIRFNFAEWDLLRSVLNEVTHAFPSLLGDFEAVIGLPKVELEAFLDYLCSLPEDAVVELDPKWILVFRNSLRETLRHIAESEFETRTGHESSEARRTLKKLDDLATV